MATTAILFIKHRKTEENTKWSKNKIEHVLNVCSIREIKIHVYGKRQTSDSSWEFLRIENKQIKTVQKNS